MSVLTRSLLCLFNKPTSNLSKSVDVFLADLAANFLAQDDACHLSPTWDFSKAFLIAPVPAARGRAGMV
jgi:hypothetical protein